MSKGFGIGEFGKMPFGSDELPASSVANFGIAAVTILLNQPIWDQLIRVTFSAPAKPDEALYDPSNYAVTVRFGRARPIFVRKVMPDNTTAPNYVDLALFVPIMNRGQYRLTISNVKSITGLPMMGGA